MKIGNICPVCNGKGYINTSLFYGKADKGKYPTCAYCNGHQVVFKKKFKKFKKNKKKALKNE